MAIYRAAAKRDMNEADIIRTLRSVGASVAQISSKGVPDLLVGFQGRTYLLEVKTPKKKLTDDQVVFHGEWNGSPIAIVHSDTEALEAIGAI
jgi:Holliday junction resolvase